MTFESHPPNCHPEQGAAESKDLPHVRMLSSKLAGLACLCLLLAACSPPNANIEDAAPADRASPRSPFLDSMTAEAEDTAEARQPGAVTNDAEDDEWIETDALDADDGGDLGTDQWEVDAAGGTCPAVTPAAETGVVQSDQVVEASGLVASRENPGVLWAHNDSGDSARIFAMTKTGEHLAEFYLAGVSAYDWEDMALGPGPEANVDYLYLGDIGDNAGSRETVIIHRVEEPFLPTDIQELPSEPLVLEYPDGPHDAEALLSDPSTGDLYIVAKVWKGEAGVYRYPAPHNPGEPYVLEALAPIPFELATAGDISPSGDYLIIRSYVHARAWPRAPGETIAEAFAIDPCEIPLTAEPQGETIAFTADGTGYYTLSEGAHQPIFFFELTAD